ncbi:MAG TPA: hypothetical protein VFE34_08585 [Dongiaceae bacterium]|jgi:hypothetical protein|nr:hypothetical protein [Dongiaceae bacterium]
MILPEVQQLARQDLQLFLHLLLRGIVRIGCHGVGPDSSAFR